ncbi:universal stress protein [Plantactinospora sp. WMMB334]|uniref:universal stress protein n=1 Tax=Plantactinospora sp. WMMB334 TaxID=3404119 RepID=UPI003B93DC99
MRRETSGRIIVGVADTLAGLRALRLAVAEARRRRTVLHAVRVWDYDTSWQGTETCFVREMDQQARAEAVAAFAVAMGAVPTDVRVEITTLAGRPGSALVDHACRDDDLLFVGTSRRSWWRRLFRPSAAEYCAVHASCPVVVVPVDTFAKMADSRSQARAIIRDLSAFGG